MKNSFKSEGWSCSNGATFQKGSPADCVFHLFKIDGGEISPDGFMVPDVLVVAIMEKDKDNGLMMRLPITVLDQLRDALRDFSVST